MCYHVLLSFLIIANNNPVSNILSSFFLPLLCSQEGARANFIAAHQDEILGRKFKEYDLIVFFYNNLFVRISSIIRTAVLTSDKLSFIC